MKKNKKNQKVEIIEEYQNGMIISRKINGMERNFVKFNKMSFEEVKSIFGEQKDL